MEAETARTRLAGLGRMPQVSLVRTRAHVY